MQNGHFPHSKNIQQQQLANGLTVLVYENFASQSVVIEGLIRAGALMEDRATAGLANFTAVSLLHGTQSRSFDQIYEELESAGAELGFSSGFHTISFSAQGLVEDIDMMLAIAVEALRQPAFPLDQIERVRGEILTSLHMRADDTGRSANLAFYELVYEGHPYGRSSAGYIETINSLTRDDIVRFHQINFGPRGGILTIVGAIKAEEALTKVEALLADWHNDDQLSPTAVTDMPRPEHLIRRQVTLRDRQQADLRLGLPGPRRAAHDYLEAALMNTILGVFGMMGRIGQNVREEKGLAYYAYSHLQGGLGPSPWLAVAGVAPQAVEAAIGAICDEIARMQNELVPPAELDDSKSFRIGSLPMALESNSGLADIITDMVLYDLGSDYLVDYAARVRAITAEQIQAAAQKYLSTDQIGVAVAGP